MAVQGCGLVGVWPPWSTCSGLYGTQEVAAGWFMPQGCSQLRGLGKFLQEESRNELQEREGSLMAAHQNEAGGSLPGMNGTSVLGPTRSSEWELGDPAVQPVAITGGLQLLVSAKVWTGRETLEPRSALN